VYTFFKSLQSFYKDESCRYVNEGTDQTLYSFTVRLNACGTQFIDQFKEGGQAYLENVLVIQNEPGIQEVYYSFRYGDFFDQLNKHQLLKEYLIPWS
jgi:hypothetical protein